MKTFEQIISEMTTEQIAAFEAEMEMPVNDVLAAIEENPLVELVATMLLNKELEEKG